MVTGMSAQVHKPDAKWPSLMVHETLSARSAQPTIMRYELSDSEWSILRTMLPNKSRGTARVDDRRVLKRYLLGAGVGMRRNARAQFEPRLTRTSNLIPAGFTARNAYANSHSTELGNGSAGPRRAQIKLHEKGQTHAVMTAWVCPLDIGNPLGAAYLLRERLNNTPPTLIRSAMAAMLLAPSNSGTTFKKPAAAWFAIVKHIKSAATPTVVLIRM